MNPSVTLRLIVPLVLSAGFAVPAMAAATAPAWTQSDEPNWPKKVEKKLYATDFRGKRAPELQIEEMLTERPDREGKVVMIDFWATWCGPCRASIPELNKLQRKFKDDMVVIGISDEQAAVVRDFMKSTEMKYSLAIDTKARTKKAMKVSGIPHVVIVSTDGVVRWQGFPASTEEPLTEEIVSQIIEADPGVKARRETEAKKKAPDGKPTESAPKPDRR